MQNNNNISTEKWILKGNYALSLILEQITSRLQNLHNFLATLFQYLELF